MASFLVLDFDGTLYPIREHNSEELLLILSGKKEGAALAGRARSVRADYEAFDRDFISIMKGVDISVAEKAAEILASLLPDGFLEPLKRIHDKGYTLKIVSCGSGSVAAAFIEKAGLSGIFDSIEARMLIPSENGKIAGIAGPISSPAEKAGFVRKLRKMGYVAACGDGPTDEQMLAQSDRGFIMAWDKPHMEGFEIVRSMEELERALDAQ